MSALQTRDDAQQTVPHYAIADARGHEGDTLTFRVTRSGGVSKMVVIAVTVTDGTAKAKLDYSTRIAPLFLFPGDTSGIVAVRTIAGPDLRPARSFTVRLATLPDGGVTDRREATGTIVADRPIKPTPTPTPSPSPSPRPTVNPNPVVIASPRPAPPDHYAIADADVREGGKLVFPIIRRGDALGVAMLDIVTVDGSGSAGRDYLATRLPVRFAPGQRRAEAAVATLPRDGKQGARTMLAQIARGPRGIVVDRASATGRIEDAPEAAPPSPQPSPSVNPSPSPSPSPSSSLSPSPSPSPSSSTASDNTGGNTTGTTGRHFDLLAWLQSTGGWGIAAIAALLAAISIAAKALLPYPSPRIRAAVDAGPGKVSGPLALSLPDIVVNAKIAADVRPTAAPILSEEPIDE